MTPTQFVILFTLFESAVDTMQHKGYNYRDEAVYHLYAYRSFAAAYTVAVGLFQLLKELVVIGFVCWMVQDLIFTVGAYGFYWSIYDAVMKLAKYGYNGFVFLRVLLAFCFLYLMI